MTMANKQSPWKSWRVLAIKASCPFLVLSLMRPSHLLVVMATAARRGATSRRKGTTSRGGAIPRSKASGSKCAQTFRFS